MRKTTEKKLVEFATGITTPAGFIGWLGYQCDQEDNGIVTGSGQIQIRYERLCEGLARLQRTENIELSDAHFEELFDLIRESSGESTMIFESTPGCQKINLETQRSVALSAIKEGVAAIIDGDEWMGKETARA